MDNKVDKEAIGSLIVTKYMWWSMGAGFIPVPFVDLAAVTGIQVKMLHDLSKVFGVEFRKNRVKSILAALVGGIGPNSAGPAVASGLKMIPVVGSFLGGMAMPGLSGASTYAVGKVFIQHFASGGTFLTFNPAAVREYFAQELENGRRAAQQAAEEIKEEAEKVVASGKGSSKKAEAHTA